MTTETTDNVTLPAMLRAKLDKFVEFSGRNFGQRVPCKLCGKEYICPDEAWEPGLEGTPQGPGWDICRACGFRRAKKNMGFPAMYFDAHLETDYDFSEEEITSFLNNSHFFQGGLGTGKTHLMYAIASRMKWRRWHGVHFVEFHALARMIKRCYRPPLYQTEDDFLKYYGRVNILFIDDVFGSKHDEGPTDDENHVSYEIIRERAQQKKRTYISSNWTLEELAKKGFNPRTIDRIKNICLEYPVHGQRQKRLQRGAR